MANTQVYFQICSWVTTIDLSIKQAKVRKCICLVDHAHYFIILHAFYLIVTVLIWAARRIDKHMILIHDYATAIIDLQIRTTNFHYRCTTQPLLIAAVTEVLQDRATWILPR